MKVTKILQHLSFPSMNDRFRTVRDSAPDTFNWIFDEPDVLLQKQPELAISFPEWLRAGSGVFHIQGKPGSGKSTLMKFICETHSKDQLLGEWADEKTLICSQFFFWRIGSAEERSLRGLIRGLLSGIIQNDPSLTKILFSNSWGSNYGHQAMSLARPLKLSDKEISAAFDMLIHDQSLIDKYCICFFIDGLDEFDESLGYTYYSLTQKLRQWSNNSAGRVKFCVSSRELPVFIKAFDEKQRITIQIFTEGDITSIVKQKLDDNEIFQKLREIEPEKCDEIKHEIIGNADGVFLWVIMLLNQLEDALINDDSVAKLEEIVMSAPLELDAFFLHILDTIPYRYRRGAYTLLAVAMRMTGMLLSENPNYILWGEVISDSPQYIMAIQCSFLLETLDCASPREITKINPPPAKMDNDTFDTRIRLTKTQVAAHCRGLLEYHEGDLVGPVFKFTHRSIPEFLQRAFSGNLETYGLDDQLVGELLVWMLMVTLRFRGKSEEPRKEPQDRESMERRKEPDDQPSDEQDEREQWDNPLLHSGCLFEIISTLLAVLQQIRLRDADATCQLLYFIDAELLQHRFQVETLDELSNTARQNYGHLSLSDDEDLSNNLTCFSMAGLMGLHEFWVWYLEKSMTPLYNQVWYLLNVILSIIERIHLYDDELKILNNWASIFEASFLAGVPVNSIVSLDPNCKSTIWHIFLLNIFACTQLNSYVSTDAWELIEMWLKYDADPRIAFWKHRGTSKPRFGELEVSGDEIIVVSEEKLTLMNISMAAHGEGEVLSFNAEDTWIERILRKRLISLEGIFTLCDIVKVENPPNVEELLRLINRNKRTREAQTNDSITEMSPSEAQLHDNRYSALELASKPRAETHDNPEPSAEVALKPDVKISITPAIKANTLLHNARVTSSLMTWIIFSKLAISLILGDL